MPKVSQDHLDARRQQILDAAVRCFAARGIHPTTMQHIVRESGLSAGAIYSYFSSKDEIVRAIADARHLWERRLIRDAVSEKDAGSSLHGLVHALFLALTDDEENERRRVGIEMWAEALHNPGVLEITREGVDEPLRMLTRWIAAAQARGELAPHLDARSLARVGVALFQGFILQKAWDERADLGGYLGVVDWLAGQLTGQPA